MGFFRTSHRPYQKPQQRSRPHLLIFLLIVFACVKLLGTPAPHIFRATKAPVKPPPPIVSIKGVNDDWTSPPQIYHFTGFRISGNGTYLDLGDRRTHLPASLLTRFFADELIVPSCLTQLPPPSPASAQPASRPLPIREDWPGLYGAPWTAQLDGNLVALLHVYAPRNTALPVAAPEFQIYPDYDGRQSTPSLSLWAPATFIRGNKAVLYRVFLNGPVRCLDLVIQNGENNGIGHLYYRKYHHYYEMDTSFQIQP